MKGFIPVLEDRNLPSSIEIEYDLFCGTATFRVPADYIPFNPPTQYIWTVYGLDEGGSIQELLVDSFSTETENFFIWTIPTLSNTTNQRRDHRIQVSLSIVDSCCGLSIPTYSPPFLLEYPKLITYSPVGQIRGNPTQFNSNIPSERVICKTEVNSFWYVLSIQSPQDSRWVDGAFNGTGVTYDNVNNEYRFSPSAANVGNSTISYDVSTIPIPLSVMIENIIIYNILSSSIDHLSNYSYRLH